MCLIRPRFMEENLEYFNDETGQWELKPDAPNWAREEFEKFYSMLNAKPDENGIIKQY